MILAMFFTPFFLFFSFSFLAPQSVAPGARAPFEIRNWILAEIDIFRRRRRRRREKEEEEEKKKKKKKKRGKKKKKKKKGKKKKRKKKKKNYSR